MHNSGGFDPSFIKFFITLAKNNNRNWFNEHKTEYQKTIVGPLCSFIETMAPRIKRISKHFIVDPRPNGGSMFRIYRDVRFTKDKRPYKEHAACQFRHRAGKDAHAPGYYVHISPHEVIFGGGIWMPPNPALNRIREAIIENPRGWQRIKENRKIIGQFGGIRGDGLKRPPRGFNPDHPHIADLKRKSFLVMRHEKPDILFKPGFIDEVDAAFRAASPLMKFISYALDIPF